MKIRGYHYKGYGNTPVAGECFPAAYRFSKNKNAGIDYK